MYHIFLDFEMHPISQKYKEERKKSANEIIEFGAVILDENFVQISKFKEYVKPNYVDVINSRIHNLTGITNEMVANAEEFNQVLKSFLEWCFTFEKEDFIIYSWSDTDLKQLKKEVKLKKYIDDGSIEKILSHWEDFQKTYSEFVKSKITKINDVLSLEKALEIVGLNFVGKQHDALFDAKNTADLFKFRMTKSEEEFLKIVCEIKKLYGENDGSSGITLGEMINFSAFQLATS